MRLAQSEVDVQVIGNEVIGQFAPGSSDLPQRPNFFQRLFGGAENKVTVSAAGYLLVHEDDVSLLVDNTKLLNAGFADPQLGPLLRAKKAQLQAQPGGP